MNRFNYIIIAAAISLCVSSCGEDFLNEVQTTRLNTDYFDTPEGLKSLANGLPQALRLAGDHEFSYVHNNYGTDEFSVGSDASNEAWNNYDSRFQSQGITGSSTNVVQVNLSWDYAYNYVNTHNTVIAKASSVLVSDPGLNDVLGTAYFMRGWMYFYLVQQWGDVPLITDPIEGLVREFTRAPRADVLQNVINDFQRAYDLLNNPAVIVPGKIYKDAAAHYLAKALLYRQSEINNDFNAATKTEDLAKALNMCNEVIANRHLANNFSDLQNYTAPNAPSEKLPEIILSAQHTAYNLGANGRFENQMCLYFISVYQNWSGMIRDVAGGREYARLRTSNYAMDVYDRVNDSRFWKSYRTTQRLNNPTQRRGKLASTLSHVKLTLGQTGIMFIINDANDAGRFEADTTMTNGVPTFNYPGATAGRQPPLVFINNGSGNWDTVRCNITNNIVPNVIPRYRKVRGVTNTPDYGYATVASGIASPGTDAMWPTLNKYLDGARNGYNASNSSRDFINARVAETHLIAAEVKVRQGDYSGALTYINTVRNRATYKTGENREAYVDGGQIYTSWESTRPTSYWDKNTYYISNNIPVTTSASVLTISSINNLPDEDMAIINKLGYTSDFDKMLCLVLNERTRELAGEMHRWTDLARTKTLIDRAYAFNEDVANAKALAEHHYLRPIPQPFLDQIHANGHALTAAEKKAMQNPGYN